MTIPCIGPAGYVEGPHGRLGGRRVHVLRADPRDVPIVIDAGGEVATGHEGQATEHLALTDSGQQDVRGGLLRLRPRPDDTATAAPDGLVPHRPGNMPQAGADPGCEQFIKRHALDRRARARQPAREGGGQSAGPRTVAALSSPPGQPR
jgi:hypothetical protein